LLAGCTALKPADPLPPAHDHPFEPTSLPAAVAPPDGAPVLAVAPVRPGPVLDGRRMLYRDGAGRIAGFADNRWAALPEAQLGPWLVAALERAGGVSAVVVPGGRGSVDLLLEAELQVLLLDAEPTPGTQRIELRLQLVERRGRQVLATRRLVENEPLAEPGPSAAVAASGRALARLLDAAAEFVREHAPAWNGGRGDG
jgi:ABC-type uncharacterized transport system auxiliary subunit